MRPAVRRALAYERPPKDIQPGAAESPGVPTLQLLLSRIAAEAGQVALNSVSQMEVFKCSVEICDSDWESFFAVCDAYDLHLPSLTIVDDSGMGDFDGTGSIFAKSVQKVDQTAGFSEVDYHIDGPPDCDGSPVEHYLSKRGVNQMENVLSGSEEDIHLQSVNIFFEQLEKTTGAERFTEPSQARPGKIREAMQAEEQQNSSIPEPHGLSARGEAAVGKATSDPFGTISSVLQMEEDESASSNSPEPAAGESVLMTKEDCTKTRQNEATQWRRPRASLCGVETGPAKDKEINMETSACLDDVKPEDLLKSQFPLSEKLSIDSWGNLEIMANDEWRENQNASNSYAISTSKTATQESSPSASVKKKRRRKRQHHTEAAEKVRGYERQRLLHFSDSDEEQCSWRGGIDLADSNVQHLFSLTEPSKNVMPSLPACSATSHVPVEMEANDLSPSGRPCESAVRQGSRDATGSAENNATEAPQNQTDDRVTLAVSNCGDMATNLQLCSKLQAEESTVSNKHPEMSVSVADGGFGKSDRTLGTVKCGGKNTLQQPDKMTAKVKSLAHNILPSTDVNDPNVEVSQSDKLSAAVPVLDGHSGSNTLCQRQTEPQQQLGIGCRHTDRYSSTLEKTPPTLSADGMLCSGALSTAQFKTSARPVLEIPNQGYSDAAALDSNPLPDECCLSESPSTSVIHNTAPHAEHPEELQNVSKLDVLSERNTRAERAEPPASQIKAFDNRNPSPAGETDLTGEGHREVKSSMYEDLPAGRRPVSSCCTLDAQSVMLLSSENIADMSVSHSDSGGQRQKDLPVKQAETQIQPVSQDTAGSNCDAVLEAECEHESETAPTPAVFAVSSFWSEMEKVTIKDILGLRMISKAAPPSPISPSQDNEQTDVLAVMDSGFSSQLDEPQQTNEDATSDANSESSSGSVSSRGVVWERKHFYSDSVTSVGDTSPPVHLGSAPTCPRKICKNVSVHNLRALQSLSNTWKGQPLQTSNKGGLENVEYCTDGQDEDLESSASSVPDRYRISLTGIFHYLFGGKESIPSQSVTGDLTACYADGNSVPETYDHFFSEFDTGNFFSPLITADQDKGEQVFSRSVSANRNLQFPEAYDYFFASSSSDDSSEESDKDCSCPVRVLNSFKQKSSASKISTDVYEDIFTDDDLRQNFFWENTFSFRKISFAGSTVPKQSLSNPEETVRPSSRSLQRTLHSMNDLGNHGVMFSDPLLYNLEDRISTQLSQQPFGFGNLEMAVSNPRLDVPLLPLRQSDMCLVCIAFASWVLKTANPQVGDAWKAVLLANVSALSAIRYLRKYVKMEAADGETKEIAFQHPF